jgi:hypothetical protein
MTMTAERIDKVTNEFRLLERRGFSRHVAGTAVRCRSSYTDGVPWSEAQLVDISLSGIGLLVPREFNVGEIMEVELVGPQGLHHLLLDAQLVWKMALHDGSYRLGCCWTRLLSNAELASVTSPPQWVDLEAREPQLEPMDRQLPAFFLLYCDS